MHVYVWQLTVAKSSSRLKQVCRLQTGVRLPNWSPNPASQVSPTVSVLPLAPFFFSTYSPVRSVGKNFIGSVFAVKKNNLRLFLETLIYPYNPHSDTAARPPSGPSKTFSIDFTMPAAADEDPMMASEFDGLRMHHEQMLEDLVPSPPSHSPRGGGEGDDAVPSLSSAPGEGGGGGGAGAGGVGIEEPFDFNDLSAATPSSTATSSRYSGKSRPLGGNLGIKPQFNLDSAER